MRILLTAAFAVSMLASAAQAKEDVTLCTDSGSPSASEISFDGADAQTLEGLRIAIHVDMTANQQNGYGKPCVRGGIALGDGEYFYVGSNKNVPPRMFLNPDNHHRFFYLSVVPKPAAALEWERKTHEAKWPVFSAAQSMFLFAELREKEKHRVIYRFFDKIPDDATLTQLACDADAGLIAPQAVTSEYGILDTNLRFQRSPPPSHHAECRGGNFMAGASAPAASAATTDDAGQPMPEGWSKDALGGVAQLESNVKCTAQIGEFHFVQLVAPASAAELGTCAYANGDARAATVRVRVFHDGVGDSQAAIAGDRVLMGVIPPPNGGAKPAYLDYQEVLPDGRLRHTVTFVSHGFPVDCVAVTANTPDEYHFAATKFLSPCLAVGD